MNNNQNKNNKNKGVYIGAFIFCILLSVYFFANYHDMTGYNMNPLGYLFCVFPVVCGLILLFCV